jgi:creatinine amidohydrolase
MKIKPPLVLILLSVLFVSAGSGGLGKLPSGLLKQEGGTHADEGETSMMLYIAPETVDMSKAVKDYDARPDRHGLSRSLEGGGHYSPTGIWGDPTLASLKKGRILTETAVREISLEIRELIDLNHEKK